AAAAQAPPLAFLSADQYLAREPEAVEWIWRGFLAEGAVTMLSGPPKRGKSTVVWSLVDALRRRADRFLGRELAPRPVVFLSEEGPSSLRPKVAGGSGLSLLDRSATFPRRPWSDLVALAAEELARVGRGLLVVDTLAWWANLGPDGEKDAGR